jgi:hypothetical protein
MITIDKCLVCNSSVDTIIELYELPLTGLYTTNPIPTILSYDNAFSYCSSCGHGMLHNQLDPSIIYNDTYTHRTSKSKYAIKGVGVFLDVLNQYTNSNTYGTVLDIGCSDGYMLSRMSADKLIGIDAAASSSFNNVEVITSNIENVDISSINPNVILMRHTIEHIQDVVSVMNKIRSCMNKDTLLMIQTPMLDILVNDLRYDHIFHQHLHYFSIASMMKMLELLGLECIHYEFDRYDWGSMILIAKLGKMKRVSNGLTVEHVLENYYRFTNSMDNISSIIGYSRDVVGYGAAQMLPILSYHIKRLDTINLVVDDDTEKDGLYYYNLPVRITSKLPDKDLTYVVTGVDSSRGINKRLIDIGVDRIVNILSVI